RAALCTCRTSRHAPRRPLAHRARGRRRASLAAARSIRDRDRVSSWLHVALLFIGAAFARELDQALARSVQQRFDRAERQPEALGSLLVRLILHVEQRYGLAVAFRQVIQHLSEADGRGIVLLGASRRR